MSFRAVPPFILLDTIPKGYSTACDFEPIMELALAFPTADNPALGAKFTPSINVKFENIAIGTFKIQSEFFIIPDKDTANRDRQIYNLAITAVCNLNDFFSLNHDIPFIYGGKIFYNTPGFDGVKKIIDISSIGSSGNQN